MVFKIKRKIDPIWVTKNLIGEIEGFTRNVLNKLTDCPKNVRKFQILRNLKNSRCVKQ